MPKPKTSANPKPGQKTASICLRLDPKRGFVFLAPSVEAFLGYDRETARREARFERKVTHPDDLPLVEDLLRGLEAGIPPPGKMELRLIHRDGHIVCLDCSFLEIRDKAGRPVALEIRARDITERRRKENRLRRREDLFTTIYRHAPVMIFALDQKGRLILWNRECERLTGWGRAELAERTEPLGKLFADRETRESFTRKFWEAEGVYSSWQVTRRDGVKRSHEWASFPLPTGEIVAVGVDTTEREEIQRELRLGEARLRQIIDLVPHFVFSKNEQGEFLLANRAVADFYGVGVEKLVGKTDYDFVPAEEADRFQKMDLEVIRTGKAEPWFEEEITNKQGRKMILLTTKIPFASALDLRPAVLGVSIDITERKQLEAELFKRAKLDSIGMLAGGIAHDFNNILAGILGHISLAELLASDKPEVIAKTAKAREGIARARHLTQQLLTFSRGGEPVLEPLRLDHLLPEAVEFALSGSQTTPSIHIREGLSGVLGEAGQLNQLFYNLALNAVQAMPEGGTFRVDADNVSLREGEIPALPPGRYIRIRARDEGAGIPPEILHNIFDPFFTTKSRGVGLGLAVAYSIVRRHQGLIKVESTPGKGALFTIYLPAVEAHEDNGVHNDEIASVPGSGRILIVDDEEAIRESIGALLSRLGYEPAVAARGEDGLKSYRKALSGGKPYRAVILDLTMPGGWSGEKTAAEIRKIHPQACLISSSGYSNDSLLANHRRHGFDGALVKPYTFAKLGAVLSATIRTCEKRQGKSGPGAKG